MKRKVKVAPTPSTPITLPAPPRTRYEIDLPENTELIITCVKGFELCAGKVLHDMYRIWVRKLPKEPRGPKPDDEERLDPNSAAAYVDDEPSGGPT